MSSTDRTTFQVVALTVLRVGAALMFMQHGAQKLLGWFGGMGADGGTADLFSLMGLAGGLELVGGALVLVGLFTRPVAFLLSGQMAVAYFMAHQPRGFLPIQNQGELAALYSFAFLALAAFGGGAWSLDVLRSRDGATGTGAGTGSPAG